MSWMRYGTLIESVDWPKSFLFLCYIYLAFFFHLPLKSKFVSVAEQREKVFSDKGVN